MPTPEIIERVKQVHAQLGDVSGAKADALKQQLATVMLEPGEKAHYRTLAQRLREAYGGFLADHPKLAAQIETLANDLSNVGL